MQILFVSGGFTHRSNNLLDSTEIFDPSLGSWKAGAALPSPRRKLQVTTIDNRVLLFGINILVAFYKKNLCKGSKYIHTLQVVGLGIQIVP